MKLDCERAALDFADRVPVTVVRPPMVLGDGDRWALGLFRSAARGIHVTPTREAHRVSLIHAADLAPALVAAARQGERAGRANGVYYAAADDRPTYAELGALIAEAMGRPRPRVLRMPGAVTGIFAAASHLLARLRDRPTILNLDKWREATAGSWICDPAKAKRDLGLACAPTRQRLAETADAYRMAGWL
jgi:nucleoside-diphosphate-sugar epimerase